MYSLFASAFLPTAGYYTESWDPGSAQRLLPSLLVKTIKKPRFLPATTNSKQLRVYFRKQFYPVIRNVPPQLGVKTLSFLLRFRSSSAPIHNIRKANFTLCFAHHTGLVSVSSYSSKEVLCARLTYGPVTSLFYIHALHDVVQGQIPQFWFVFLVQYFLPMKRGQTEFKLDLKLLLRKRWWPLPHIWHMCWDLEAFANSPDT